MTGDGKMSNIKLLDCTLRDGGYVNNWHFGNNNIKVINPYFFIKQLNITTSINLKRKNNKKEIKE